MHVKKYFFYPLLALMGGLLVSCATQKEAAQSTPDRVFEQTDMTNKEMATAEKGGKGDFSELVPTVSPPKLPSPNPAPSVGEDVTEDVPSPVASESSRAKETTPHLPSVETSHAPKSAVPEQYRVVLDADKQINIPGEPGELKVWIGDSAYEQPEAHEDMVRAKTVIRNTKAKRWAKISPYGEAFTITPVEPIACFEIDPSGSEMRFNLVPKKSKSGEYKVGATVYLYGRDDCSDTPIPKFSADLRVSVHVNKKEVAKAIAYARGEELWEVFWKGLMDFWGALVAAVFGTILFMVRKKLKNWFGYTKEKSE